MCFVVILLLAIFHSFFTSFLLLNKSKDYEWLNDSFTPLHLKPLYENNNYILYATRYTFLKIKSAEIISNDYLWGIGYENFRKSKIKEYPFLEDTKPHSTYLGILSEFGIFGFISIIIILLYSLRISLNENNYKINYLSIIIIYFILEGIHADIITLKIIWIIFAMTISLRHYKIYHSAHNRNILD